MLFRRQIIPAIGMLVALTVLCGLVYPLAVTGVAQLTMSGRADGSIVTVDGEPVGSRLIGQAFTQPQYFHPRPSAAGEGYDAMSSAGSNLGPTNPDLLAAVEERVSVYREENGLDATSQIPVDAVTASGSGLDPHISIENARLQAERVAEARDLDRSQVLDAISAHTDSRSFGVLGQPGVNVLELNVALDRLG